MRKEGLERLEEEFAVEEERGDGVDGRLVTLAGGLLQEDVEGVEGGRGKEELFEGAEEEVHGGREAEAVAEAGAGERGEGPRGWEERSRPRQVALFGLFCPVRRAARMR